MVIETAWAVAPTFVRDEVLKQGLLPRVEHGEDELYLFDTRERAERFAASGLEFYVDTPEGRADVWEAQVGGLPVSLLPNEDGPSAFVKGMIPPAGLRLVHTLR